MADLRLQVILTALDKITAPLKKIRDASAPTSAALKATTDRLKELNAQQKSLNQFRDLHQGLGSTTAKLKEAQTGVNRLAKELQLTTTPARALTREFNTAVKAARTLKTEHGQQSHRLQQLRDRLSSAGIATNQLGKAQIWLKDSIRTTNAELTHQQTRLTTLAAQQQRVSAARHYGDKLRATAGQAAMTGAGSMVAGRVAGAPLLSGLSEARHYQTETGRITALGLGSQVSKEAEQFARKLKTYGTSQLENLELVRDSMSVFGDLPHAKMVTPLLAQMKFGNKAFYGEDRGADNESKFMDMLKVIEVRGGLASPEKFRQQANMVQKVITATGGRVGPGEWLNMIKTGGLAAKGMRDDAFYYQMEPMVQELGGHRVGTGLTAAYNNLYQGRTSKRAALNLDKLGLIGDHSKVTYDKAGQTAQLNPGALLGSDLFKQSQFEWMEKILLPQLAKKGITHKDRITDTIGSLFSNGRGADLYGNMVLQRSQIHKNETLNRGAFDIDRITALGKQQTAGQELEATARLADLKLALGEKIIPLYTGAVTGLTDSIKELNTFISDNPALSKAMIIALGAVAAIAVTLGAAMLALSPFIAAYALMYVSFARLGVAGGALMPVLRGVGAAVALIGRTLLMNPIGLAVTAIAVSALLLYTYWEPISTFFNGLWSGITTTFNNVRTTVKSTVSGLCTDIKTAFNNIMNWFGQLPGRFGEFGGNLMTGLANGIRNSLEYVKTAVTGAGENVITWFRDKLGIHSPSRVFAELGDYTLQGFTKGLQRSETAPLTQLNQFAKRLTQLGAGIAIGTAAMPAMSFDTKPPLAPHAGINTSGRQGDTINITINPSPGMDEAAIAREVARILNNIEHQKAARKRSGLADY